MGSAFRSLRFHATFACALAALIPQLTAQTSFTQDFTSSATIGDYVGIPPGGGQLDAIGGGGGVTWSIAGGALQVARAGTGAAWLDRTTDVLGAPLSAVALSFQFRTVDVTTASAAASLVFYVGDGLTSLGTAPTAGIHSQFGIQLNNTASEAWFLRDIAGATNGAASGGTAFQAVTFVVNNSGAPLTYAMGGGVTGTVADDSWDLWLGGTRQFAGVAATNGVVALAEFKLRWGGGQGTVQLDNIALTNLAAPIPEPSTWAALIGAASLGVVMLARRRAAKSGN
jgi:hypothetical protein